MCRTSVPSVAGLPPRGCREYPGPPCRGASFEWVCPLPNGTFSDGQRSPQVPLGLARPTHPRRRESPGPGTESGTEKGGRKKARTEPFEPAPSRRRRARDPLSTGRPGPFPGPTPLPGRHPGLPTSGRPLHLARTAWRGHDRRAAQHRREPGGRSTGKSLRWTIEEVTRLLVLVNSRLAWENRTNGQITRVIGTAQIVLAGRRLRRVRRGLRSVGRIRSPGRPAATCERYVPTTPPATPSHRTRRAGLAALT